ncbi:hypothetical protein [Rhizobium phaseoli]|uniref:Uncharacterized protein n=1 Tax=Rhizobium phaseoli TaxID=396 RepID=A0ABM6C9D5_9HYPH|nr:hypothetical protein [Rhizobium phaseoli]ANL84673.1 hypothetical protein AMC81_CH01892 [Rhizobium phaseoli]ANL91180.1 hypothetical protein AMC80_CH01892 [Rhizobium phaseoli]
MSGAVLTVSTDDGEDIPIIQLLDEYGDETDDLEEAAFAICQTKDGRLVAVQITACEEVTIN